jgi:phage-related baseplate assembly protein
MAKLVNFVIPNFNQNLVDAVLAYQTGSITEDNPAGTVLTADDLEYDVLVANAAAKTQYEVILNDVGNNNYVDHASGDILDLKGESAGLPRMGSQKALTTLKFTFDSALINTKTILAGTTAYNSSGDTKNFRTLETQVITAGQTFVSIEAEAESAGSTYNGFGAGEIDTLGSAIEFVDSVANTIISGGGGDVETDPRYRTRIKLANNKPSLGSDDGMKATALEVSTELCDASVIDANNGASPGEADVYILKKDVAVASLHSSANYAVVITQASSVLNNTKYRPVNTSVNVYSPTVKEFTLAVSISVWADADTSNLIANVQKVIREWRDELRNTLGAVFYAQVIQARIEALSEVVQATVTVTWAGTTPNTPKMAKDQIAFLSSVPTPTISEYIER